MTITHRTCISFLFIALSLPALAFSQAPAATPTPIAGSGYEVGTPPEECNPPKELRTWHMFGTGSDNVHTNINAGFNAALGKAHLAVYTAVATHLNATCTNRGFGLNSDYYGEHFEPSAPEEACTGPAATGGVYDCLVTIHTTAWCCN